MEKIKLVKDVPSFVSLNTREIDHQARYVFKRRAPLKIAAVSGVPLALVLIKLCLAWWGIKEGMSTVIQAGVPLYALAVGIIYYFLQGEMHIDQQGIRWTGWYELRRGRQILWSAVTRAVLIIETRANTPLIICNIADRQQISLNSTFWRNDQQFEVIDVVRGFYPQLQPITNQEFAKMQYGQDIGKNAGKMTAIAVAGLVIGALVLFLDPYATIELGQFFYFNCALAFAGFAWAWWMIKSPMSMLGAKIMIAMLCAGGVFFAGSQVVLASLSQVIQPTPITFTMQSKKRYEIWKSDYQLSVDCIATPRPVGMQKVAQVIQLGGLNRLKFTDVCIPSNQL